MADAANLILDGLDSWVAWINGNVPSPQMFNQVWGWNMPSMNKQDLLDEILETRHLVQQFGNSVVDPVTIQRLNETPARLNFISTNVLPNLPSGNAYFAVAEIRDELRRLNRLIPSPAPAPPPLPDWEKLADAGMLPKRLVTRIRSIEARLASIEPRTGDLNAKIALIEDAFNSAERLPTDLASLAEGQREVERARLQVASSAVEANTAKVETEAQLAVVTDFASKADEKFKSLEKVYRAAATKGLASAFAKRALFMNLSVAIWVILLAGDLGIAAYLGSQRFALLERLLAHNIAPNIFWGNLAFSLVSVAAPIWFGWVATKQISQRFKLAEDYNFKASVASAYEGYRTEAVRLEGDFEKRLFGSALSRLEEAPLRFMDQENFGTPWQELTSSPAFLKALELVPALKDTVAKVVASATSGASAAAAALKLVSSSDGKEKSTADEDASTPSVKSV